MGCSRDILVSQVIIQISYIRAHRVESATIKGISTMFSTESSRRRLLAIVKFRQISEGGGGCLEYFIASMVKIIEF